MAPFHARRMNTFHIMNLRSSNSITFKHRSDNKTVESNKDYQELHRDKKRKLVIKQKWSQL